MSVQRHPICSLCVALLRLKLLVAIPICLGQSRFLYLYKLLVLRTGFEPVTLPWKGNDLNHLSNGAFCNFWIIPRVTNCANIRFGGECAWSRGSTYLRSLVLRASERMERIELSSSDWKSDIINHYTTLAISILEIPVCRCIGFLAFNKPAGLILLKLVKLLGGSTTCLCSSETVV